MVINEDINLIVSEELEWKLLKNKTVLITGACGFLARYIVLSLLRLNELYNYKIQILALCRDEKKARELYKNEYLNSYLKFIFKDVCNLHDEEIRCDIIIHAASPANPYVIESNPYDVIEANVLGLDNLLKQTTTWGCNHVVLFSSSAVYGYNSPCDGADELYAQSVHFNDYKDVYALSKQMCEMMRSCYKKTNDLKIQVVRPFVIYGPGDNLNSKKCFIDFLNNCIEESDIVIKSDGKAVRSYIYIVDAIRAFFYILLRGDEKPYNIASKNAILSIDQLANIFAKVNGTIAVKYEKDDSGYLKNNMQYMIGKTDRLCELGWNEMISIQDGISRTIKWARDERNKKS